MSNWQQTDIAANDINIHCYRSERQDQPLIILAHGFSDNGLCWQRTAQHLTDRFDVLMFDARNHGLSSKAEAGAEAMAEDLAALIECVSPEKPVYLLGHSMGASTAASVAAKYPSRVKAALLEDPPWTEPAAKQSDEQARQAAKKRGEDFRKFLELMKSRSIERAIQFGRGLYPDWHDDDLPAWAESKLQVSDEAAKGLNFPAWQSVGPEITVPTLLIYTDGERDGMLLQGVVDQLTNQNGHLSGACIKGAGHNIRRENFADFISAVDTFLAANYLAAT